MKLNMLGYAPIPFHSRKWMLFFDLIDSILTRKRLQHSQCLITTLIKRNIWIYELSASQIAILLFPIFFCLLLSYNKLFLFHSFTLSATLFNMLRRTYFSSLFQEHKRFFKQISIQNISMNSLYRLESKRLTYFFYPKTRWAN